MQKVWPFEWFHFCLTYKNDGYDIVTNGKIWHSEPKSVNEDDLELYFIETLTIGSGDTGDLVFTGGRISGFNICLDNNDNTQQPLEIKKGTWMN